MNTVVDSILPCRSGSVFVELKLTHELPSTTTKLLVSSIYITCFGRTRHLQAFKYPISN